MIIDVVILALVFGAGVAFGQGKLRVVTSPGNTVEA